MNGNRLTSQSGKGAKATFGLPSLPLALLLVGLPPAFIPAPAPEPNIFFRSFSCLIEAASAEKMLPLLEELEKIDLRVEVNEVEGKTSFPFVKIDSPTFASLYTSKEVFLSTRITEHCCCVAAIAVLTLYRHGESSAD